MEANQVMESKWKVGIAWLSGGVFGAVTVFLGMQMHIRQNIVQPFHREAVDRGFASWIVTDNATGSTRFAWNEVDGTLHAANNNDLFERTAQPLPGKE